MTRRWLRRLAERVGIISEYVSQTGRTVRTTDTTREALLAVMGLESPSEEAARGWLDELEYERRAEVVAPVRVVARDTKAATYVPIEVPDGMTAGDVELTITEETGQVWRVRDGVRRARHLALPGRLPYGYHTVDVVFRAGAKEWRREQSLIVTPPRCISAEQLFGKRKLMGVVANLYAQRREHDWGVGDFATLTALVEWAAARGAQFVGINPLHALFNRGIDISPYSPVSRLFRNPLYIDVEAVPELASSETARAVLNEPETRKALQAARATGLVDYDGVLTLKNRALIEMHRTFRARGGQRVKDFDDFAGRREPELSLFATWMAIASDSGVPDWRRWPAAFHAPDSPQVQAFREANPERVDYHRWLQFEVHRQLGEAALRANTLGMTPGIYQDLAIGTNPGGSDAWSYQDLFLAGASVGAPPDPYSATGQNWGLPPLDPRALRRQRYRYWIQLLRRAFEHTGALRIDHVMGLFRLFWIPEGGTGKDGAYVRVPSDDLLGILALESVRHSALVVGEDLGTVPADVPPALKRWGLLSSKVLYFERRGTDFKPAARYAPNALATANTHDMATLAGFWTERDIAIRAQVGLLPTAADVRREKRARAADKDALLRRLRLSPPRRYEEETFPQTLIAAVHEFLCSTPSVLVGQSLDDLVGETEPVNVPGVGPDRYPSWRRKSRMTIEEMSWSFAVDDAIRCTTRRVTGNERGSKS